MKYHIYNADGLPLYWDEDVLEFDTYESAARFLVSAMASSEHLEDFWSGAEIIEDIIFTDEESGHLNATNLMVVCDDEGCCVLMTL